jgi:hypothetical protein
MGFHGYFSTFAPLGKDRIGVKILDMKRFETLMANTFGEGWGNRIVTRNSEDKSNYPYQTYICFEGFSDVVNRFGYGYDRDEFMKFIVELSCCMEPFTFFHTPSDNDFPSILDMAENNDVDESLLKFDCNNGDISVTEKTFGFKKEEIISGHSQ